MQVPKIIESQQKRLEEMLEQDDSPYLNVQEVGKFLGTDPDCIRSGWFTLAGYSRTCSPDCVALLWCARPGRDVNQQRFYGAAATLAVRYRYKPTGWQQ